MVYGMCTHNWQLMSMPRAFARATITVQRLLETSSQIRGCLYDRGEWGFFEYFVRQGQVSSVRAINKGIISKETVVWERKTRNSRGWNFHRTKITKLTFRTVWPLLDLKRTANTWNADFWNLVSVLIGSLSTHLIANFRSSGIWHCSFWNENKKTKKTKTI